MLLGVQLGPLRLANPILLASGTCGYGRELAAVFPLSRLGAIMVKGTAPVPWEGNRGVRIAETPSGMLNAIGLENPGLAHLLYHDLPWLREQGVPVIVNLVGRTMEEYVAVAHGLLGQPGVVGLELNISCPNVKEGGMHFGHDPDSAARLTAMVKEANPLPLIVKLSPNAPDLVAVAQAVVAAGADVLSLINTYLAMRIDIRNRRPVLGTAVGGLSGPAIKPLALRWVWEVASRVDVPIIGMGGVERAEDAVEFLMAGASAVAVGSASFRNPRAGLDVLEGLQALMAEHGVADVREWIGAARGN